MAQFVNNDPTFQECHIGLEDTHCELDILVKMLWYYEKTFGKPYYYKLDSIFNKHGNVFRNGVFNTNNIDNAITSMEMA